MVSQSELRALIDGDHISISSLKKVSMIYEKFLKYPKLTKKLIKVLIKVWSEEDEASRVLAFLILVKVLQKKHEFVESSIKLLYTSYIRGCKFMNAKTAGWIQFMQRSLCEVLRLNLDEAYQHAFVYIRQMGITLRKAIVNTKKEFSQSVYNWQFISCLSLWSRFLSENSTNHELLASLVHPLVHIISGCIKLTPSARWLPLRFHCVSYLNMLARARPDNGVPTHKKENVSTISRLTPALPHILEVFQLIDLNKRTQAASHNKALNPRLMLHGSNSQMKDQRYRDMVVDCLYEQLVENLAAHANSPAFPEYCVIMVTILKDFTKKCKISNYTKPFKGLLSKIEENSNFIKSKRTQIKSLTDKSGLDLFRETVNAPFFSYAESYRNARKAELEQLIVANPDDKEDEDDDDNDSEISEVPSHDNNDDDESSVDFGSDENENDGDDNSDSSELGEDVIEDMDVDEDGDEEAQGSGDEIEDDTKEPDPEPVHQKSRKKLKKKLSVKKQMHFKKPKSKKKTFKK